MKTNRILLLVSIILLAVLIFRTCSEENYDYPDNVIITAEEASQMRNLYMQNQFRYINQGLKAQYSNAKKDHTYFTIKLNDLKSYIKYAEGIANKQGYKHLGFRIQLAAKKDLETSVPYTNMYYMLVGSKNGGLDDINLDDIKYDTIPQMIVADKVGVPDNIDREREKDSTNTGG